MTNEDLKRFYYNNPNINEAGEFVRLDSTGKISSKVLPGYVDDVIEGYYYDGKFYEDSNHTKLITGESGKIYVDLTTNCSYRWGGTVYALISNPNPSDVIKKVEVTNITEIDSDILSSVNCGDVIIKNESGNKHTYIITYKQEEQGICLSYMDATIIETVSYDYVDGEWIYNSTDVGHLTIE